MAIVPYKQLIPIPDPPRTGWKQEEAPESYVVVRNFSIPPSSQSNLSLNGEAFSNLVDLCNAINRGDYPHLQKPSQTGALPTQTLTQSVVAPTVSRPTPIPIAPPPTAVAPTVPRPAPIPIAPPPAAAPEPAPAALPPPVAPPLVPAAAPEPAPAEPPIPNPAPAAPVPVLAALGTPAPATPLPDAPDLPPEPALETSSESASRTPSATQALRLGTAAQIASSGTVAQDLSTSKTPSQPLLTNTTPLPTTPTQSEKQNVENAISAKMLASPNGTGIHTAEILQKPSLQGQPAINNAIFTSAQQRGFIVQQVVWMNVLLGQSTGALLQSLQLLHSVNQMGKELSALQNQIQQAIAKQGDNPTQNLNTLLGSIAKQMKEMGAALIPQHAFAEGLETPLGNPAATVALLKEHCETLLRQAADNAQVKINEALAQRSNSAMAKELIASSSQSSTPAAPHERTQTQPATQNQTAIKQPSEREQRTSVQIGSKGELQQPSAKNTHTPVVVTVALPVQHQIQTPVGGSKNKNSGEQEDQEDIGGASPLHTQQMVYIPEGPMIFGTDLQLIEIPSFLIASACVTNAQFADWLNEAFSAKKVHLAHNGIVVDQHKNVICKTHSSSPSSQIQIHINKNSVSFDVLTGGEKVPVVEVSWFGAQMYCDHYGLRLPTEAEWEKAAGMQPQQTPEDPLIKFRFGNGTNSINLTQANYKTQANSKLQQLPKPIGFYNGQTQFSIGNTLYTTQDTQSPYGCYDMSGNVRQWTDGAEMQKIAKGGSFLTTVEELEVTAQALCDPTSCMPDTGFRVALSS